MPDKPELITNEYKIQQTERNGILLCLRHDSEKTQDSEAYIKQGLDFLSEDNCLTDNGEACVQK